MDRLSSLLSRVARIMAWIAGLALVGMVAVVVVDVVGRHIAPGLSIRGAIELVSVLLVAVGFFGLAQAFDRDGNLTVEIATAAAPERVRRGLDLFWSLVGAAVLAFLCWMALDTGLSMERTGQVSEILRIRPMVAYGLAALGLAVAVPEALNAALRRTRGRGQDTQEH